MIVLDKLILERGGTKHIFMCLKNTYGISRGASQTGWMASTQLG